MKNSRIIAILAAAFAIGTLGCKGSGSGKNHETDQVTGDTLVDHRGTGEKHLMNVHQLTHGGNNAEAYFSFDNTQLVFQSDYEKWGVKCDQIFTFNISEAEKDTLEPKMLSTSFGRTTCSYFLPDGKHIVYASTHLADSACPPVPEYVPGGKYLWPVYAGYDIFTADLDGNIISRLTSEEGYDAEATVSPKGDKIVFTSTRSGDLELYTMNLDGSDVKQITNQLGYDGGAFFSPDGSKLVFRSSRPKTAEEIKEYKDLLAQGLVAPTNMEIYTCNIDGSDLKQITNLGKANWAPFYHPDGKRIIFSSNHASERGFGFNLFMINEDGTGLEQITTESEFNAFPMFSYDGKKLVFSSNRNNGGTRHTNIFIADWVD
ncbi:MAG: PD40 domain-containing protein [Flavobacteriales bacterium]|nr:PD40 domain-containing protein [Flavobacteriales bacterium]